MTNIRKIMSSGGGGGGGPGEEPWGYNYPNDSYGPGCQAGIYLHTWGSGITYDDQDPAEEWESGDSEPTHYSPYILNGPHLLMDAAYPSRPGNSNATWQRPIAGNGNLVNTTEISGIWAAGNNSYGVLGAPVPPAGHALTGWTEIGRDTYISGETEPSWYLLSRTGNSYHGLQKENYSGNPRGSMWGWGYNQDGRLGDGTYVDKYDGPVQIGSYTEWARQDTGPGASLFVRDDGTLWSTGAAALNGHNNSTDYNVPTLLGGTDQYSRVSCGGCMGAIKYVGQGSGGGFGPANDTYGTLWTWGYGGKGRLGHGNETNLTVPTQVGTDDDWTDIECNGSQTTYALKLDGTMWGWGHNNNGQVGDGTTIDRWSPVQIGTTSDWGNTFGQGGGHMQVAGYNFMFQIKEFADIYGGELWGWGTGSGRMGLGPNDTGNKLVPTRIGDKDDWFWVSGGTNHALGIRNVNCGGLL